MKNIACFLFFLTLTSTASACFNEYYSIDRKGEAHSFHPDYYRFEAGFNRESIETELINLEKRLLEKHDYKLLSDYAILLAKGGKIAQSLELLRTLQSVHKDEYELAANLGTIYELAGKPDSALIYIKKGIELNPDSHHASEWIHVRILIAQVQLLANKNYLHKNSVLNLTAEQKKDTVILKQLYYQLHERFPFCQQPDQIMAELFMNLGDCAANTLSIEYAKVLYDIAKHRYGLEPALADRKMNEMRKLREKYNEVNSPEDRAVKIGGVSYSQVVWEPGGIDYSIRWNKINLNTPKLLQMAGILVAVLAAQQPQKARVSVPEATPIVEKTELKPKGRNNYLLFTSFAIALGGFFWWLIRRKK